MYSYSDDAVTYKTGKWRSDTWHVLCTFYNQIAMVQVLEFIGANSHQGKQNLVRVKEEF